MVPSWRFTKKALLVLLLVGFTLGTMRLTAVGEGRELISLEGWVRDVAAPVQGGIWQAAEALQAGAVFVFSGERNSGYLRSLEKRIAELEGEIRHLRAVEQENQRLRSLLAYQEAQEGPSIVAAVIARNPGNWFGTVTLNRGSADGVTRGSVVVTPVGLVGRVWSVSNRTAEVLLITDPRSAVGSVVYETGIPGIVRGMPVGTEGLKMRYVVKDEEIRKGYLVLTSNLSGVFPPGIPVGTVIGSKEEESGLFKTVFLRPAVDLRRLEEVLVLLKQ